MAVIVFWSRDRDMENQMPTSIATTYRRKAAEMREAALNATTAGVREIAEQSAALYSDLAYRLERIDQAALDRKVA